MIGIYKIKSVVNSNCYVGSAVDIVKRWRTHKNCLRKGTHSNKYLQNAWNKYLESSFAFEIIEEVLEKTLLIEREQHYTDALRPEYAIRKQCVASQLGTVRSEESRQKMRKNHANFSGSNNPMYGKIGRKSPFKGKKHSKESKEKMRHAFLGKLRSEESRLKQSLTMKKKWAKSVSK